MNLVIMESKYAAEARNQVWDFTSRLAVGETISTATASSAVYSGADAAANPTLGTPSISGAKVTVATSGGVLGVVYLLGCTAVTSAAQTLRLSGLLAVVPLSQ